uniref:Galectin domain-containing protein n=1 Tax=Meloidogyne hapla TaxID=6305 RepID=A0A1I8BDN9_MELHA
MLTEMDKAAFEFPYSIFDQCMYRPDYQEKSSYSFHFYLKAGYLCDGLLICYPGQLDSKFVRHGVVTSFDYKTENKKNNLAYVMCEQKRKEYCNGKGLKSLCKLAETVEVPWHGFLIWRDAADNNLTLVISIYDIIYHIGTEENIEIKFGEDDRDFSVQVLVGIKGNQSLVRFPDPLKDKFLNRSINSIGGVANYSSLWFLGFDIFPKEYNNKLSLFIDRGCKCSMKAWFKREKKISKENGEILKNWLKTTEIGNNKCPITKASEHYKINGTDKIEIKFNIFVNNFNAKAVFNLINKENGKLLIEVNEKKINFNKDVIDGKWIHDEILFKSTDNLMTKGTTIFIKIKIFNYYSEFIVGNGTKTLTNKFWYNKWWEIINPKGFEMLEMEGDFFVLNAITEDKDKEMETINLPNSNKINNNFMNNGTTLTIKGYIKPEAKNLEILLLHDGPEFDKNVGATVMKIDVEYRSDEIIMSTYFGGKYTDNVTHKGAKEIFVRGSIFQCTIEMENLDDGSLKEAIFNLYINDTKYITYYGSFPFWATNWIQVKGDAILLEEPFIISPVILLKILTNVSRD